MASNKSPPTNKPKRLSHDESLLSQSQLLPPRPPPTSSISSPSIPDPPPPPTQHSSRSSTPSPSPPNEDASHDLPLSMSTSLLLSSPALPTDARSALSQLSKDLDPPTLKVAIRFHAIGSAPQLKQKVYRISASSKFGAVVAFLRKRLYGKPASAAEWQVGGGGDAQGGIEGQGLFCYVNSVFAPGLDEGVGNLWRCFKTDDQLIVGYSITPAFG